MAKVNPVQVQKFLSGIDYPIAKDQLLSHAQSEGADSTMIGLLNKLPNESYQTPADISQAIGNLE